MKKICESCGEEWNDWFMRFLNWLFRSPYEFKTCQKCRDKLSMKYEQERIEMMYGSD